MGGYAQHKNLQHRRLYKVGARIELLMINSRQTGVFVRDLEFPGQNEGSHGISLWYAANSGYTTISPTGDAGPKAELPEAVDPDTVFLSVYSICAAPFNGSIFSYWKNRTDSAVINIATSPYHSRELSSILDERYPGARQATRLSFALVIDICNYALQHLIPYIDIQTSTAQLGNIKSSTLGVLGYVVQHFTVPKAVSVTSFANVTYNAKYRLDRATCVGQESNTPSVGTNEDQYQPYLPGFEPEDAPAQPDTQAQADTVLPAELVASDSIAEDLVRSATGTELKDVSEAAASTVSEDAKQISADVSIHITIPEGVDVSRSGLWHMLEPVHDKVTCYTANDASTPFIRLDFSVSDVAELLRAISMCKQ